MAYQQVSLELERDGQCTPWGFRMTGGADIGTPLIIQKISFGSPSEGELQRGDIIVRIRDTDATRLSHKGATDLISKAGSTLKIVLARNVSSNPTGPGGTPMTPPLRPNLASCDGSPFLFKSLPTTNFGQQRQRRSSAESFSSTTSTDTEKEAITNQPYRSTPLILPGAKSSKDVPTGSYLRFDPLSKRTCTSPRLVDPYMLTKVQEAIIEAAQSSSNVSSPGRNTPDFGMLNGPQMYLRQYNSPIHMYSNQAIVEALAAQTQCKNPSFNADVLENKKLSNIMESPTYQLIHDEEWKRGKVEEFEPLKEHVYNVMPRGGDHYRPEIHQSESMKSIMRDLKSVSDF